MALASSVSWFQLRRLAHWCTGGVPDPERARARLESASVCEARRRGSAVLEPHLMTWDTKCLKEASGELRGASVAVGRRPSDDVD